MSRCSAAPRDRTDRVLLLGFGAIVALTSIAFYSAIDRLPLGIADILVGQRVGRRMPELGAIATSTAIAAIILIPSGVAGASSDMLSPGPLATAVVIGVLSVVVPISLGVSALRTLPPRVYGILTSLEPALAALAGLVLLGQHLGARDAVAICCVVVASLGAARSLPPVPAEF